MKREVLIPDIGDFKDVEVVEILVAAGDQVRQNDSLISIESDKATLEIPAPAAGTVVELHVRLGDRVSQGSRVLTLEAEAAAEATAPAAGSATAQTRPPQAGARPAEPAPAARAAAAPAAVQAPARSAAPAAEEPAARAPGPIDASSRPHGVPPASPSVRRLARELGVDLARVRGSGPKGRILRGDVQEHVKRALSGGAQAPAGGALQLEPEPAIDFAKFGPIEVQELSRIRRIAGARLHGAWVRIPHVTQFDEADITDLEQFRRSHQADAERRGVKLTLLPFLMKAAVGALRAYPQFNASLEPGGERLILKRYFHIGVAVDTPHGLVVPVVRDVDAKGLIELAAELADTSERARNRKLRPEELSGGTFSISSLGGIGGTLFTPIINPPEVAILGVSRYAWRPVYQGNEFVPRLMLPLSLSYDHRVIDGADGARFTSQLKADLADIRNLLL
jgi:pyruvate dehydrogenase E2 component (dihydrolipoamide acetyltransferase)